MSVVKNLMVRAGADFSAISKQAKKATASMRSMESGVKKSCSVMSSAAAKMSKAFSLIGVGLSVAGIAALSKSAKEAFDTQAEAEAKLAQVIRNTIGASAAEIKSIKELASAQQELGVIGDEVQLAGAQELATYVSMTSTLKTLIPVMNDMAAQQFGLGATAENTANIATMLGKVMSGQTSGLSRYGYYFTKAQEAVLKYGDEAERAATLAEVVRQSVGGMNAALAATPSGRLKQVSNTLGDIKENFGQAVTTIATVFLPGLNAVCSMLANVATLANKVAQAIANVFGGGAAKSTAAVVSYTAAASSAMDDLTESTNKAGAAAKKSLGTFSFDTLNKLSASSASASGAGGAGDGSGGGGLITETTGEAEEAAESIGWLEKALERIKKSLKESDFRKVGEIVAEGLNSVIENWDAEAWGTFLGEKINNGLYVVSGFISKFDFEGLGLKIAQGINGLFSSVDWGEAGRTFSNGLKGIWDSINSFLDTVDWKSIGNTIATFINNIDWPGIASKVAHNVSSTISAAADLLIGFAEKLDWKKLGSDVWKNLLEVIKGINWSGLVAKAFELLGAAVGAASQFCMGFAMAAWDSIKSAFEKTKEYFHSYIEDAGGNIILGLFNGILDALKNIGKWIVDHIFKPFIDGFKRAFGIHSPSTVMEEQGGYLIEGLLNGISKSWASIVDFFKEKLESIKQTFSEAWTQIKDAASTAWESVKNAWSDAGSWFSSTVAEPVKTAWSTGMEAVKNKASEAWAGVQNAWSTAKEWFSGTVIEPLKAVWELGMTALTVAAAAAWKVIQDTWNVISDWFSSTIVEPIKTAWSAGMEAVKNKASEAWTAVQNAWSAAGSWFSSTVAEPVKTAWSTGMEAVKNKASEAWTAVQNAWSAAGSWFSSTVAEPIKTAWSAGMESVKSLGSSAWENVKSVWSSAAGWFKSSVTDPISNSFKSFANTAIGFFEGLANGAIKGVNGIINALNRIHIDIPSWVPGFGGNSWGFNLPTVSSISLPRLANGAVFEGNNPYLAIVNDQKHGVNVESPLSTIVEAMMIALRESDFGGGDINVNVRAVFEGQLAALARYLRPYFEAEAARVGPRASKGGV